MQKKMAGEKEKWQHIEKKEKMAIVQRLYLIEQNGHGCIFEMCIFSKLESVKSIEKRL